MKTGKLARILLRILAVLFLLAVFAVLDWYPTVKDLGWLRRECSELERKTKDYGAMASGFAFPDKKEELNVAFGETLLLRSLPQVENDDTWLGMVRSEQAAQANGMAGLTVFSKAEAFAPGPSGLSDWLKLQERKLRLVFQASDPRQVYPWRGVFLQEPADDRQLASRLLGVAVEAPMAKLLGFVNHISWSESRLEIVSLRVEPAGQLARAWLVCRGSYMAREPSPWAVKMEPEEDGEDLLVDPDSPLLLRRVDSFRALRVEKRELPPASRGKRE